MKYKTIVDHIIDQIHSGRYKKGMRMPSIRKMAETHQVNKSTVIKAYEVLETSHILYSIPKSGYYVIGDIAESNHNSNIIDFYHIAPDNKLLPYQEFNHCINRAIDKYKKELFIYGDAQGLVTLRKALADFFSSKSIYTRETNICITSGAHQALNILAGMKFPNNKKRILIEQPTYSEIYDILHYSNREYLTINRDANGLNLEEIGRIFKEKDIKFFYTMPKYHNPLGTNLSAGQKKQLLDMAEKYDVYIVEDDYLADIEAPKHNLPMHYYDTHGRVIYLRSFSKSFIPGNRLGCALLNDDEMVGEFLRIKRSMDLNTSVLMQGALELYITSGMYASHTKRINAVYKKKYEAFVRQVNTLDKEQKYIKPAQNSLVFWLALGNMDSTEFAKKLLAKGVQTGDGKQNLVKGSIRNGLRLSIMSLSGEEIRQGINIIYDELSKKFPQ